MATAPRANAGDGRGDEAVNDVTRQLEALTVGPLLEKIITRGCRFVYFDLETTGLGHDSHITQIAACSGEHDTFSSFVLPKIPIPERVMEITGITCREGRMYLYGNEVPCLIIRQALKNFIDYLEKEEPVMIVGHNIKSFDCPILLKALQAFDLVERFQNAVHGCVDTLPLFRQINREVPNHKLATLYRHYMGQDFPAHDAREDVQALRQIVARAVFGLCDSYSFSFDEIIQRERIKPAWKRLVRMGLVSQYMANKAIKKGFSWENVVDTYKHDGEDEVRKLLRSHLTDLPKIIDCICQHLRDETPDDA